MSELRGLGVSRGTGCGPVARLRTDLLDLEAAGGESTTAAAARARDALAAVSVELSRRAAVAGGVGGDVLEAQALMAADPALAIDVERRALGGASAARSVHEAFAVYRSALAFAGGHLAARVPDLDDVRDRAVAACLGIEAPRLPTLATAHVLVARTLAPADTAILDLELVVAIVTEEGGPTSHTAIVARERGIPAVVGCAGARWLADGQTIAVDGAAGVVDLEPPAPLPPDRQWRPAVRRLSRPNATADGHRVRILANVASRDDSVAAAETGAEGIGLFRTEFLFLHAECAPTVEEQRRQYTAAFEPFGGRTVVARVLDAGADKPMPFLALPGEANPALGVRGIRALQQRPDVLRTQLEAIALAAADSGAVVSVMASMIAGPAQAQWFAEQVRPFGFAAVGAMIEVPSAALLADAVVAELDFVSIGTNDLTQFAVAADRTVAALSDMHDAWNPAVLRLIAMTLRAAVDAGKFATVCGEAAADPLLACVLIGLGADSLSMSRTAFVDVNESVATRSRAECAEMARIALLAPDGAAARAAARRLA